MSQILLIVFEVLLLQKAWGLNPQNNACTSVEAYRIALIAPNCNYNPDVSSNIQDIVSRFNYVLETYNVTTKDGFILSLFRISTSNQTDGKPPVLLVHGLTFSPDYWITNGDNGSLAFQLIKKNYDVWIASFRGTRYTKHTTMKKSNPQFWNFTLDTLASIDFPAQVDFIYTKTQQKVLVIGHSKGTTVGFMNAAENPEEANKSIKGFIALAPIVYLKNVQVMKYFLPWAPTLLNLCIDLKILAVGYPEEPIHQLKLFLVRIIPEFYAFLLHIQEHLNTDMLMLFWSLWPSPTSAYELSHFLQIAGSNKLQKYDYGTERNLQLYGSEVPPVYNLTKVEVPVSILYGLNDHLVLEENMNQLYDEFGSTEKKIHSVPYNGNKSTNYGHVDFLYNYNITQNLYPDLFKIISSFITE